MRFHSRSSSSARLAAILGAALVSCGGGRDAMRPEQPKAADAMGSTSIKPVEGPSSPLVVDWKSEQRADLEEVIHDGVAVVAWDDKGLRLLKRCKLSGDYGYLPVQIKKDVVRLETADEVQASLPLGGVGLAGKIGGGFAQGTTLDIALAMVGKRRTTWNDVKPGDLKGDCAGATHYVRALTVGAFAMKTGTKASAAAAVTIFGAGGGGKTESSKDVGSSDGRVDDCDKATGEETKPPGQCAAILRLELEPIGKGETVAAKPSAAKAAPELKSDVAESCPPGFVPSGGACKKQGGQTAHVCSPRDAVDCETQCQKGSVASCDQLGLLIASGAKGRRDPVAAQAAFTKACDGGFASGCANLGISLLESGGANSSKAGAALESGCRNGSARACETAGEMAMNGQSGAKDIPRALRLFSKGCEGGSYVACTNAGFLLAGGGGATVTRDDRRALDFARRACFGGEPTACGNAGYKIELGEGISASPESALALYERACRLDPSECFREGLLLSFGAGSVHKDASKAKALLEKSCETSRGGLSALGCVVATHLYSSRVLRPTGLDHIVSTMRPQCDQKEGRACTFLGLAELGMGKTADSRTHLKAACGFRDPLGCELGRMR